MDSSIKFANLLDREDHLAAFRSHFYIPRSKEKEQIYFCGNSLGLQPRSVQPAIKKILDQWKSHGVESWFLEEASWMSITEKMIPPMAKLVGAKDPEIAIMNTLSVNLHLLMASFYRPHAHRSKILIEKNAFPSDHHVVASQLEWHGLNPKDHILYVDAPKGQELIRNNDIAELISIHKSELALVLLGGLNYYSGQLLDIRQIAKSCKENNLVLGLDLAHAAGNVPMNLHSWGVDFAAWCTYKYLNSGPGGPGAIFVHENRSNEKALKLKGWWGHEESTRFEMKSEHKASPGASGWQISTPQILNLIGLQESLKIFEAAGMAKINEKRIRMNHYFDFLIEDLKHKNKKIRSITPSESNERGAQLSLVIEENPKIIFDTLSERGIIGDWRDPDIIRLSPAPLYNSFEEIHKVYQTLLEIL